MAENDKDDSSDTIATSIQPLSRNVVASGVSALVHEEQNQADKEQEHTSESNRSLEDSRGEFGEHDFGVKKTVKKSKKRLVAPPSARDDSTTQDSQEDTHRVIRDGENITFSLTRSFDATSIPSNGFSDIEEEMSLDATIGDAPLIGRFIPDVELGMGGQGAVYKCHAADNPDYVVAIKTLNLTRNQIEALEENFKIIDTLSHDNICKVRDHGIDSESQSYLLVMEYVDGKDLKGWKNKLFPDGVCTLKSILPIVKQSAAALDYVHDKGVVHKDIKPGNIMITRDGLVKLFDFSLASRIADENNGLGNLGGTAQYMPPEQLAEVLNAYKGGSIPTHEHVSKFSDQYALAVIIYELLAGNKPFGRIRHEPGTDRNLYLKRLYDYQTHWEYEPIPKVPKFVNKAIKRALSPNPSHRFTTCCELYDALAQNQYDWKQYTGGIVAATIVIVGFCIIPLLYSFFINNDSGSNSIPLNSRRSKSSNEIPNPDIDLFVVLKDTKLPNSKKQHEWKDFEHSGFNKLLSTTEGAIDLFTRSSLSQQKSNLRILININVVLLENALTARNVLLDEHQPIRDIWNSIQSRITSLDGRQSSEGELVKWGCGVFVSNARQIIEDFDRQLDLVDALDVNDYTPVKYNEIIHGVSPEDLKQIEYCKEGIEKEFQTTREEFARLYDNLGQELRTLAEQFGEFRLATDETQAAKMQLWEESLEKLRQQKDKLAISLASFQKNEGSLAQLWNAYEEEQQLSKQGNELQGVLEKALKKQRVLKDNKEFTPN